MSVNEMHVVIAPVVRRVAGHTKTGSRRITGINDGITWLSDRYSQAIESTRSAGLKRRANVCRSPARQLLSNFFIKVSKDALPPANVDVHYTLNLRSVH